MVLDALDAPDWATLLEAIASAGKWLRSAPIADPHLDRVVEKLVELAQHTKWEVRREVANAAAFTRHDAFHAVLAKLSSDDNHLVRQAALHASTRRRDWGSASALGKQHVEHINATLEDIEARFGQRGRTAVMRAAEEIANVFARELYHEVIKLISPLAASAERLSVLLEAEDRSTKNLKNETLRIQSRVARLQAIIEAMRAYTAQPKLVFQTESIQEVVEECVALVRERAETKIVFVSSIAAVCSADIDRTRLVQALTNVLQNAVEAYAGDEGEVNIRVTDEGVRVIIAVEDRGRGMSREALKDAIALFSTSKPNGTGFGLPLAIKIVETEHNGRLAIESTKGKGTSAKIILPKRKAE
jgi:signal transduction histidine kinase